MKRLSQETEVKTPYCAKISVPTREEMLAGTVFGDPHVFERALQTLREGDVIQISIPVSGDQILVHASGATPQIAPPIWGTYLIYFLPRKDREPLLGCLEEEYQEVISKFGTQRAKFWYYFQVASSFWPILAAFLKRLFTLGVAGWIKQRLQH